jgi:hypothetical protein
MSFNKENIAFGSSNSTMIVQSPAPDPHVTTTPAPQPASNEPSPSPASPNATT